MHMDTYLEPGVLPSRNGGLLEASPILAVPQCNSSAVEGRGGEDG